ncbi:hypothetical protein OIU74_004685 [Salix koriyanagi]|uniref:Uncharacterized protein n=2 Tax=Salix TaxID=40685 RepID=A0A9Q0UMR4_9ROSI|nr:hypothetical protein OIU84_030171 [Salix udensis]KAJ6732783.1 hypothetical protein OIU74_004685 [Salix koriyanagi]
MQHKQELRFGIKTKVKSRVKNIIACHIKHKVKSHEIKILSY